MATETLWRLTRHAYAESAFTGEGARRYGGRFNSRGVPVVYAAESLALALVETLVGLTDYSDLHRYVFFRVEIDSGEVERLPEARLPEGWDARPPTHTSQEIGGRWAEEERSLALRVPSVVVPYSFNYLLNPRHAAFDTLPIHEAEALPVDERLA
jgi:RES domain-containing protein